MKRITLEVVGGTESPACAIHVTEAIRALAPELAAPGMVGGRREFGGLTISWAREVVAEREVKP